MRLQLQAERSECGLACLCMIAGHFGSKITLAELRDAYGSFRLGTTGEHLALVARRIGFSVQGLRVEIEELRLLEEPVILHWNMDHFVVLKKTKRRRLIILDPAIGQRSVSMAEANQSFTGVIFRLERSTDFENIEKERRPQKTRPKLSLAELVRGVSGFGSAALQVASATLLIQFLALLTPLLVKVIVDSVVPLGATDMILTIMVGFALLAVLNSLFIWVRSTSIRILAHKLTRTVSQGLFSHLVRLPIRFFEQRHSGSIISRFQSIVAVERTLTSGVIEAIIDSLLVTTLLAAMIFLNLQLVLVTMMTMVLVALARLMFYRKFFDQSQSILQSSAASQSKLIETIKSIHGVKAMGLENVREDIWSQRNDAALSKNFQFRQLTTNVEFLQSTIMSIGTVVFLSLGAYLSISNQLSIGLLLAMLGYQTIAVGALHRLITNIQEFRLMGLHLERMADIALSSIEKHYDSTQPIVTSIDSPLKLTLNDISFRYSDEQQLVLRNINLTIPPGTTVGIVGRTGAGKTTLLKVILGLEDPMGGSILIDDIPIEVIGKSAYRKTVGCVLQDDYLLEGTIVENAACYDSSPDISRVQEVLDIVLMRKEIAQLPMGIMTKVGEAAKTLSEGQKQRLMLARALYRNPRLLILDEATAHLDLATERALTYNLRALKTTRIYVSHRPTLLANTDVVLALDDGDLSAIDKTLAKFSQDSTSRSQI